jgi:hypothetical protein
MLDLHIPDKTGITLFMVGAIIGLGMFVNFFLQDTEGLVFSALVSGDRVLNSLSCPEIITEKETGVIRANLHNATEKPHFRTVRTGITQGYLTFRREVVDHYTLEPGETRQLRWEIYPEDAAYGYLILVKVYFFPQRLVPSYVGVCGVMLLKTKLLTGWQIIGIVWGISLSLMAAGYTRYIRHNQPLVRRRQALAVNLRVIAVTIILANATAFIENWYLEVGFFLFSMILMAESVFYFSQS